MHLSTCVIYELKYNLKVIEGASILFIGIFIGYFIRSFISVKEAEQVIKEHLSNKKGVIVDLTPPVDLGEIIYEEKTIK